MAHRARPVALHAVIPAAIVTFHPDAAWPARLDAVLREHPRAVVVDNSTEPDARAFVAAAVSNRPGASLLALPENPGIGAALNLAFSTLAAEGHTRVAAYDQDSVPAPGFADALAATAAAHPHAAVVGANWTDPSRPGQAARFLRAAGPFGLGFRRIPATRDLSDLLCVITSGALFDLSIWHSLHGFSADLFLDLVDTDYCLRANRAGYDILACSAARLDHRRGAKRSVRLLGRTCYPANTPPFRLRCLSRNRILVFRRLHLRPFAWVLYELAYATKLLADALFLEEHKIIRLHAMLAGTMDGLRGRSGPMHPTPFQLLS